MIRPVVLTIAAISIATPLQAARFQFCWIGGGGYTMEGIIEVPDDLVGTGIINETQVTGFRIYGFHNGIPVGSWTLEQLTPQTTWTLSFDTTKLEFPTGGERLLNRYQAWNANGAVNDCGVGGFGFNAGNWAQDVCIDNTYIDVSSIDRYTPLPAFAMDVEMTCNAVQPMS